MVDHVDFSVVVKQRGRPPFPWRWEIYRAGRNTPEIKGFLWDRDRSQPRWKDGAKLFLSEFQD